MVKIKRFALENICRARRPRRDAESDVVPQIWFSRWFRVYNVVH